MTDSKKIDDGGPANVRWLPIALADKTITDVQEFGEVGITIKTSDRFWVRDDDGRIYEAAWSEGRYGRDYWWDFEGESPVDPVEFMPHPLDPRWVDAPKSSRVGADVTNHGSKSLLDPEYVTPAGDA